MKKLNIIVLALLLFVTSSSKAQISVNVNFGTPPVWAPADRVETQYYYLPEVDSYYDVPSQQFIFLNNGVWIRSRVLPARYRNYNLRNGKVIYLTDYRGNSPYTYYKDHKVKYVATHYREPKRTVIVRENHDNGNHREKGRGGEHGKGRKH